MIFSVSTFLAAAATSAAVTPRVRDQALRSGAAQRASAARGAHQRAVPRVGGVGIVAGCYVALGLASLHPAVRQAVLEHGPLAVALAVGGLAIAGLGLFDDLVGATASQKVGVQVVVALAAYAAGFRIDQVTNPLGGEVPLGVLGLPLTVLWIVGVVNAMNLIDGLDGLAGGVALLATITIFVVAKSQGDLFLSVAVAAMAGATAGFLLYNFNPASVFMGDTGSMFLGFVLAVTSIHANEKSTATVALAVPILALGLPITDTLLSMARRAARGTPLFCADRGHIHHRLLDLGLSHRQAVLVLYVAASGLAAASLVLGVASTREALVVLVAVGAVGFVGLRALGYLDLARAPELLAQRRAAMARQAGLAKVKARLAAAADAAGLRDGLRDGAAIVEARWIALAGVAPEVDFATGAAPPTGAAHRFPLAPSGVLELGWGDGRTALGWSDAAVVEQLCDAAGAAVARFGARRGRGPGAATRRRQGVQASRRVARTFRALAMKSRSHL